MDWRAPRDPYPHGLPDEAVRVLALVLAIIVSLLLLTAMVVMAG
jgi:hypothetical protein